MLVTMMIMAARCGFNISGLVSRDKHSRQLCDTQSHRQGDIRYAKEMLNFIIITITECSSSKTGATHKQADIRYSKETSSSYKNTNRYTPTR